MSDKMTSADVREALLKRWPPDQYISIPEAPQNSDRSGRKLDVAIVSMWKSRGLSIDGVEIKVSMSDWKRELDEPDKADWWHAHVHRFWIAAPAEIAKKIKPQLPVGWGLLSCTPTATKALVHPTVNPSPIPFTWPETVGLLRANSGLSVNMLGREYARGLQDGREMGSRVASINNGEADPDEIRRLRSIESQFVRLNSAVDAFEKASGIKVDASRFDMDRIGEAVKVLRAGYLQGPDVISRRLERESEQLRSIATSVDELLASFKATLSPD